MSQNNLLETLTEWRQAEYATRHSAAIFLILYSLVGLDIMSIQNKKTREKATATWVAWGVAFVLIGFFIISPEQEAIQKAKNQAISK